MTSCAASGCPSGSEEGGDKVDHESVGRYASKPCNVRWAARIILILWAGFWLFFNIGSFFAELPAEGVGAAVNHLTVALITLALFIVAWRWELIGALLLLVGVAFAVFFFHLYRFDSSSSIFVLLTLTLPMIVVATLLTASWAMSRSTRTSAR